MTFGKSDACEQRSEAAFCRGKMSRGEVFIINKTICVMSIFACCLFEETLNPTHPHAKCNMKYSRHFKLLARADSWPNFFFFLPPKRDRTHISNHTVCIWGLLDHGHMYRQTYRQLLLLFYGTIALVSGTAVLLLTLNTQRQNVHFSVSRVVMACGPLHQKAKQKRVVVVMDRICHSAGSRLMLLSCTLQLYN